MNQEYATCKAELKKAKKKAEDLNQQVHDYIAKVRAAEETLQQKVKKLSEFSRGLKCHNLFWGCGDGMVICQMLPVLTLLMSFVMIYMLLAII